MRLRLFLGSSREAIGVCRAVQRELDDAFDVTVWDQDVFRLSYNAMDSLLSTLDSSDAGVFVLRPDDVVVKRNVAQPAARDNVVFELGMFVGRLGRDRTIMITPRHVPLELPSDLGGLTTAEYDADRFDEEPRAAVGPACTSIREHLARLQGRATEEPESRRRLDCAMARMSRDLESLFERQPLPEGTVADEPRAEGPVKIRLGKAEVELELGRIEESTTEDERSVVALPANEYFDDECITDRNSSLGAFVQTAYGSRIDDLVRHVRLDLRGLPSQRVPRAERRVDNSYGIGQTVYVHDLSAAHRVILVSATTERVGIGLRAEPHFLYAAVEGVVRRMNVHRLNRVSMPVFGAGHGGMPLPVALLFNVLALRSVLDDDIGRKVRHVRVVVFGTDPRQLSQGWLRHVLAGSAP